MESNVFVSQIFTNILSQAGQCRAVPIFANWDLAQITFQL